MAEFFYSTCLASGALTTSYIRNTNRSNRSAKTIVKHSLMAELKVYHAGHLVLQNTPQEILPGGYLKVSEEQIRNSLSTPDLKMSDLLISINLNKKNDPKDSFFSQEHQVVYTDAHKESSCSLLYDQMPIPSTSGTPIVLLAPKIWLRPGTEVFLIVANRSNSTDTQTRDLKFGLYSTQGHCLTTWACEEIRNSVKIFAIHDIIEKQTPQAKSGQFFNIFGYGGSSAYVLYTIIKDKATGNMAVEHSLSPHYYFSGDRSQVRQDVVSFEWSKLKELM